MTSIRHFPATHPLPDWRNFGVVLRALLAINGLAVLAALVQSHELGEWPDRYVDMAAIVEPILLLALGLLALLRDPLWRLPLRLGQATVLLLGGALTVGLLAYGRWLSFDEQPGIWRSGLLAIAAGGLLLTYFELRSRAFSPIQAEARLAALNARIRPHFLFNSLNAVLSLIRARPQQAEAALESLADLFRAAMRDPGELISLGDEIDLGKQYLQLEQLRLGERLHSTWQIGEIPLHLPIPPLMLQPLLENAVHHGIEPNPAGGTIAIRIEQHGDNLQLTITNPPAPPAQHTPGNQMALANIRERLALYYDLEASLEIVPEADRYEVRITLPCRQKSR